MELESPTSKSDIAGAEPKEYHPLVRLRDLCKSYGNTEAVQSLDLDIYAGDFVAILGPSGCGKTTLLRMIGGFVTPTKGVIEIDGVDVTNIGPEFRPTNMVFQSYGLFPHMTVGQNVAYGLRVAKRPKSEITERVEEVLHLVHMSDFVERRIDALSGGQQQRVALARALVMRPKVLLLDEPLAALDLKLRQAMQEELRRIHDQIGGTFVFVTHDQGEAMALANRISVMHEGAIVQDGAPEEIYARPATRFVSTFIGEANLFAGTRRNGEIELEAGARVKEPGDDGDVVLVVRPEAMRLDCNEINTDIVLHGVIQDIIYSGAYVRYLMRLENDQEIAIHSADAALRGKLAKDAIVVVGWHAEQHFVLERS